MTGKELSAGQKGFSLIELLITVAIFSLVMAAAFSSYISFVKSSSKELTIDNVNADAKLALKILEKDLITAAYGLPKRAKLASANNCNTGDEDFCKTGSDRIFIADGWEILTDITDNNEDDGALITWQTSTIPNANGLILAVTQRLINKNYYSATLSSGATAGGASINVNGLNINLGQEITTDDDFKPNSAIIIADDNASEGHRTVTVDVGAINFLGNEELLNSFSTGTFSSVVPAYAYYVRKDPDGRTYPDGTSVFWLYRNESRILPYVDNLQIRYGYDALNDGLQWADTVPPSSFIPDGQSSYNITQLKAVEITLTVRISYRENGTDRIQSIPYTVIVGLRNTV